MTQGITGTYAFNGVSLTLQPTEGRWLERDSYGEDGEGHPIYSGVRSFQMTFNIESITDFDQLRSAYALVSSTGTVIVDLPQFDANVYTFKSYTGCILYEPVMDVYFTEHGQGVTMRIGNIR